MEDAAPTGKPLRFRLFLLAASGLLPLAVVAVVAVAYLVHDRRQETQRSVLELSRALATAADAELRATVSVLQSLGGTEDLSIARLDAFQAQARRVAQQQGWRTVVLADATGRVLMSSSTPLGTALPVPADPASMQRVLSRREPVVGQLALGPRSNSAFAVRVPVMRKGSVAYVLSAAIPPERMDGVIRRQNVPPTWVVALLDQTGALVVRSRPHASNRASPSLQALLDTGAPEGMAPTFTLEGVRSYTGFSRLRDSGWAVAVGVPAQEAETSIAGPLGAVAGGLLASLALSAYLAWFFSRRVSEPIDQLKEAAAALGRGEPLRLTPLGVSELDEVAAALARASRQHDQATAERRAAEAEREALLQRVTQALQIAEDAARSKDEFLAMLGHELRNPLAPIATAMHIMARKGDEHTQAEREIVQRQLAHMTRLVDDLLDVSRITGKRLAMRMKPVALAPLLTHAAAALRPLLAGRELRLEIAPDAAALWVSADEDRLGQVLNNLVGNAIKFTGPQDRIELRVARDGDAGARIEVSDTGQGMSPQVLRHVFDLFYQAPQASDRARGGLGLGLAIVRSLAEMHGGSVEAHSEGPGHGSRFVLRLPAIAVPAEPAPETPPAPAATGGKVLVVDDNQDAADTAAALLEIAGYETRTAYEPQAALAAFESFQPDLSLLDIGLPGMSGYELAEQLRALPHGSRCRLVALTGYGTPADVARAREAGFDAHLAKPAAPDALLELIQRLLASSAAPA